MEIVQGETVFACIICDEGFDFIDEVNKHIADAHEDIHILKLGSSELYHNFFPTNDCFVTG